MMADLHPLLEPCGPARETMPRSADPLEIIAQLVHMVQALLVGAGCQQADAAERFWAWPLQPSSADQAARLDAASKLLGGLGVVADVNEPPRAVSPTYTVLDESGDAFSLGDDAGASFGVPVDHQDSDEEFQ